MNFYFLYFLSKQALIPNYFHLVPSLELSLLYCLLFPIFIVANYSSSDALLPVSSAQAPNELLNFIEKQENYIEQLEKESNFCRVSKD